MFNKKLEKHRTESKRTLINWCIFGSHQLLGYHQNHKCKVKKDREYHMLKLSKKVIDHKDQWNSVAEEVERET